MLPGCVPAEGWLKSSRTKVEERPGVDSHAQGLRLLQFDLYPEGVHRADIDRSRNQRKDWFDGVRFRRIGISYFGLNSPEFKRRKQFVSVS
jgi:hypothetical protein